MITIYCIGYYWMGEAIAEWSLVKANRDANIGTACEAGEVHFEFEVDQSVSADESRVSEIAEALAHVHLLTSVPKTTSRIQCDQ